MTEETKVVINTEEGETIVVKGVQGEKGSPGIDGRDGVDGKDGRDGRDGKDGKNGRDGKDGALGPRGDKGVPGKDAVSIDVGDIIKEVKKSIGKPEKGTIDQRWHGGGLSKVSTDSTLTGLGTPSSPLSVIGGGGLTELPAIGLVNSSNVTFTFTQVPSYIVADGLWFKKLDSNSNVQWSSSGLTITMSNPPSNSIFGIA